MRLLKKVLSKYKKLAAPVKASIWFAVSTALQRGITLLTMPIFTRLLTTEQYGMYSIYRSWYDILVIFGTLNIFNACYSKGILKYEKKEKIFTSSLQGLMSLITVMLAVMYFLAPEFWNGFLGLTSIYVYALLIEMLFVPAYSLWCMKERFNYRYKKVVLSTIFIAVMTPLLGIIAVTSTVYKAEARVLSYVVVQLMISVPFYVFNFFQGRKLFVKEYWKYAILFSIPLIPHYLSSVILNQSDRIMIGNMVGSGEAAIYSIAYTISTMVSIITNAIQSSFMPYTYRSLKDREMKKVIESASEICILVCGLCFTAMLFGPEIIRIFASKEYYAAIWIIPPVAASIFFVFLYNVFVNIELYYEKNSITMLVTVVGAVLNLILNYIFIRRFGYVAAGYTTLFCYVLFAVVHGFVVNYLAKQYYPNERIHYQLIKTLSVVMLMFVLISSFSYKYAILRIAIVFTVLIAAIAKRKWIVGTLRKTLNK